MYVFVTIIALIAYRRPLKCKFETYVAKKTYSTDQIVYCSLLLQLVKYKWEVTIKPAIRKIPQVALDTERGREATEFVAANQAPACNADCKILLAALNWA